MKPHSPHFTAFLFALLFCCCVAAPPPSPCHSSTRSLPFCNAGMPIDQRAADLVSRLTLDEKISQLVDNASEIPRFGIPAYQWWSEALHGVSGYGRGVTFNGNITGATSFPQVIVSAATFDPQLWYQIGQAIGKEGREMYNSGQAKGLTFWTPNVNIFRDPRWGRGQETPGEDPLVGSKYAAAYVRGIQGDAFEGESRVKEQLLVSACCKHFTAYDVENWHGHDRYGFDAKVTAQDLADTYQPPFRGCVEQGKASGIMCAYTSVNGVPNCADYHLLTKTARGQWGFYGYIASDCDAVMTIHENHKYTNTPEDAVAQVLKAGMDLNCGTYLLNHTKLAVDQKKLSEADIDRALANLFAIRMRLGLFDDQQPSDASSLVCSDQHQQLALEAARNGIVLLKNSANLLPLSKSGISSLAAIGPNAANGYALLGNYEGQPCKSIPILAALKAYVSNTSFNVGCHAINCTLATVEDAVTLAKQVDYVVLVMGLDQTQETESHDRDDLTLPGQQETLINAIAAASVKPVVLVLLSGGPLDVSFAKDHPKIGAIVWAGYPGEAGGVALAQILFGDHNPGGRLPVTWYPKEFTATVPMTDMRMRPDPSSGYPGRTYRFYTGLKVFDFGYGLSYTNFSHHLLPKSTPNTIRLMADPKSTTRYLNVSDIACDRLTFSTHVRVVNRGEIAGKHTVLLFIKGGNGSKQLVGFNNVKLGPGEWEEVEFVLNACQHFSTANEEGLMVIKEGQRYLVLEDEEYPINILLSI